MSVIETKIFIVLIYYTLAWVVILADVSLENAKLDTKVEELQKYFICEGLGSGSPCDKSQLHQISTPWLTLTRSVLLSLLPAVSLVFIISWKDAKRALQEKFRKIALLKEKSSKDVERHGSLDGTDAQFNLSALGKSDTATNDALHLKTFNRNS